MDNSKLAKNKLIKKFSNLTQFCIIKPPIGFAQLSKVRFIAIFCKTSSTTALISDSLPLTQTDRLADSPEL